FVRQHTIEAGRYRGNAAAVVVDDAVEALCQIDVAQEPNDAVEQKILDGGVKLELQLSSNPIVEFVDGGVERRHRVAVAHRREGAGDGRGCGAGLIGDAHD